MTRPVLAALGLLACLSPLAAAPAAALACEKPDAPEIRRMNARGEFEAKAREVEAYQRDIARYIDCLGKEAKDTQAALNQTLDDWNKAVEAWQKQTR